MGGAIDVESTVGAGSTFSVEVTLPVAAEHDITDDSQDLAGVRIVLADRDDTMRPLFARYLAHCGTDVVTADDLSSVPALCQGAVAENRPFAVAVLGSCWPLERQIDVAEDLRKLSGSPGVVALTHDRFAGRRSAIEGLRYVDAAPMRRAPFLRAVAVATGRLGPEADDDTTPARHERGKAPSARWPRRPRERAFRSKGRQPNERILRYRQVAAPHRHQPRPRAAGRRGGDYRRRPAGGALVL